uniref:Uncharacterized protein n=1 Tax=Emiliania huxleyi TaxID=2903 RepID=A0A7S3S6R0_EMIHU
MLASSARRLLTLASCCSPRIHPPLASAPRPEADSTASERRRVVAALKRFDQLEAMSSRGDPEGCSCALEELRRLREDGTAFALGPNAHNRAMRVCASSPGTVETLFAEAAAAGVQDDASLQVLATCRLEAEDFAGAAAALSELLGPLLVQPAHGAARRRVPARTAKVALSVLGACRDASVCGDECRGAGRVQPRPNRRDPTAETAPRRQQRCLARVASPGFLVRGRSGAAVGGPRGGWPVGASCSASLARADPRPPQAGLRREWGGGRGGGSDRGARVRGRAAEEVEDGGGGGGGLPAGLVLVVISGQLGSARVISRDLDAGLVGLVVRRPRAAPLLGGRLPLRGTLMTSQSAMLAGASSRRWSRFTRAARWSPSSCSGRGP